MYQRQMKSRLDESLADTPVVILNGPRQSGKTTLVREYADDLRPYRTLDNANDRSVASSDPLGYLQAADHVILDEVQRAPELFLAIKELVDRDRRPGRFLLTGSAEILSLPSIRDSLAGRMEVLPLLPLAISETRAGSGTGFLNALFAGGLVAPANPVLGPALTTLVLSGGFPEMLARPSERRRIAWSKSYVEALLRRDVPDISAIEKPDALARLVDLLAVLDGQTVNFNEIGNRIGIDHKTVERYTGLLENLFLVRRLKPWFRNELKRLVKTPKLHFGDSGLVAGIRGVTAAAIAANRALLGPLLETFAIAEISKLASWADQEYRLSHYRDHAGYEVDLVVETLGGHVAGIEIKASATITAQDFRGLKHLAAAAGNDFVQGIVLYDGDRVLPFGQLLAAVPVSALWG